MRVSTKMTQCTPVLALVLLALPLLHTAVAMAAAPVPVTAWFYAQTPAVAEWAKAYNAKFNANNPDIALNFQVMPYDYMVTTVVVASAAGTGPDLCYYSANLIPNRIGQGLTLPLNRYLDAYPERKDFIPDLFTSVSDGKGQIHAMPFAMWGIFDLYNTEVFAMNGVEIPDDWDSLLKATRKITSYDSDGSIKAYGYAAMHHRTPAFYALHLAMEQLGKGLISMGDTKADLDNERGIRALTYLNDLWQAGMPDNNPNAHQLVNSMNGKVAVKGSATYDLLDVDPESTRGLEPRRTVGPTPGQDMVRYNAGTMYIVSTSKHPDEAWRVLVDFLSPENHASYIGAQVSYLPVRRSVLTKMSAIVKHPLAVKMANIMYPPMTTYGGVHTYWSDTFTPAGDLILSVLQGKRGTIGALEEAARLMNTRLAEKLASEK